MFAFVDDSAMESEEVCDNVLFPVFFFCLPIANVSFKPINLWLASIKNLTENCSGSLWLANQQVE